MSHPKEFQIKDFTYDLPEERIAKYPLAERDSSKLLIYRNGKIEEDIYRNIDSYIPEDSLLVLNDTRVVHARMIFYNASGGKIEIFCLEPAEENSEPASAMTQKKSVRWNCLVGRMNRWKEDILLHQHKEINFAAKIISKNENDYTIEFNWSPEEYSFAEVMEHLGEMPIPPYLKRESEEIDANRYQTVYAREKGSVAAPTAGLHFTEQVFSKLNAKNIQSNYVTLHVGAGTFKPVKSETLSDHIMHSEWIDVNIETLENIYSILADENQKTKIIAVGTTSLRTLETLYWMGVRAYNNSESTLADLEVKQWDAYENDKTLNADRAIDSLLSWMKKEKLQRLICKTQMLIVPSYKLQIAQALITNFHQPNSTLLLLVAAVTQGKWRDIYDYALENDFRFLSYGDGSIIYS